MPSFSSPLSDIRFLLTEVHDVGSLTSLPGYSEMTPDLIVSVLEEAGRLCDEVLAPLNQSGDAQGSRYDNGEVRTPDGFREAYRAFVDGGWGGVTAPEEWGGQGLPHIVHVVLDELLCSSNLSFAMFPGLTHGAVVALDAHASQELKEKYLPKLVSGDWSATMCLTEAHAGTDLGMIRTKAVPAGDGAYRLAGQKIFITAGEHDLAENIIHLVLAKLPDAPAGTRGISLFLVPKFLPTDDGKPGTRNGVRCGSIEHKMGIKASPTCVLDFDDAIGFMVGEPHKGMRAMFTMMNGARIGVGLQGLGLAEASYQNAVAYSRERLQGRSLSGPKNPDGPADPIIVHADVRKSLMTMRAFIEGARALAYWVGMYLDTGERSEDEASRLEAEDMLALMTPIIKALFTDYGFLSTNLGLQCLGGHGYIREFGMEQFVRDARIGMIYEGTNAIQALDLVGRKLPMENGRLVRRYFEQLGKRVDTASKDPELADFASRLAEAVNILQESTLTIAKRSAGNPDEAGAASTDYLHMFGLVALGDMWLRMAAVAQQKSGAMGEPFYENKLVTANFYFTKMLPQVYALKATIGAGAEPVMALDAESF
jgi:alkylation response protein AidB-like acyl-CoA dehydrogenase